MNFAETMSKTGIAIQGLVRSVNEYTSEKTKKVYYSVDVDVKETRLPVNIKLPLEYDRSKIIEGEVQRFNCKFQAAYGGKGLEIVAL